MHYFRLVDHRSNSLRWLHSTCIPIKLYRLQLDPSLIHIYYFDSRQLQKICMRSYKHLVSIYLSTQILVPIYSLVTFIHTHSCRSFIIESSPTVRNLPSCCTSIFMTANLSIVVVTRLDQSHVLSTLFPRFKKKHTHTHLWVIYAITQYIAQSTFKPSQDLFFVQY